MKQERSRCHDRLSHRPVPLRSLNEVGTVAAALAISLRAVIASCVDHNLLEPIAEALCLRGSRLLLDVRTVKSISWVTTYLLLRYIKLYIRFGRLATKNLVKLNGTYPGFLRSPRPGSTAAVVVRGTESGPRAV